MPHGFSGFISRVYPAEVHMTIHFHIGKTPVVITIGDTPIAPVLHELQEKDEVLLLTGMQFPREGQLSRYIMRKFTRRAG
jgi:hypothetical protein